MQDKCVMRTAFYCYHTLIGSVSCCIIYLIPSDLVIMEVVPSKVREVSA